MQSSSRLSVNLSGIRNNIQKLTSSFGHVMVMVKANAYGTDQHTLSKFLHTHPNIPFLGVSHVWEGISLREAGVTLPIFVISAPPHEAEYVVAYQLTPAVSTIVEVEKLNYAAQKLNKKLPVHLHLDTGMNRSGVSFSKAFDLYTTIQNAPSLYLEGLMTHFAAAEFPEFDYFTLHQIRQFKEFLDSLPIRPRWVHAANSGGAVRFPLPFCNLARIGLGFLGYGICLEGVNPVLTLSTKLTAINTGKMGESVSYRRTYTVKQEKERIGVVPFGYHDGFPRSLSNKGYVLIRGKKAPMIGAICMDFMMIDLTNIPEAQIGDEVLLFGLDLPPTTVASWIEIDVRELLVGLSNRVQRFWIYPDNPYPNNLKNWNLGCVQARA